MKLEDKKMWAAVLERNQALDGQFVYAVKTTGVFCRPSCPSRRPHRRNVLFFPTPKAAADEGFRPCARCRPEQPHSGAGRLVETLSTYIDQHLDQKLTLKQLAAVAGLSAFHLQRLFKAQTGMTPRQYAERQRLAAVKRALRSGQTVTESLYEAGYSSPSRLYEKSAAKLGMTPGAYRKHGRGQAIKYAYLRSPLGPLLLAATKSGLVFAQFGTSKRQLVQELQAQFGAAEIAEDARELGGIIETVDSYLGGRSGAVDCAVDLGGTDFQRTVWNYLRSIPAGETRTYRQVAQAIGRPDAVRAVARACALNMIALAVPCHRVVRSDGGLAGYRWGLERKEALLERERRGKQR